MTPSSIYKVKFYCWNIFFIGEHCTPIYSASKRYIKRTRLYIKGQQRIALTFDSYILYIYINTISGVTVCSWLSWVNKNLLHSFPRFQQSVIKAAPQTCKFIRGAQALQLDYNMFEAISSSRNVQHFSGRHTYKKESMVKAMETPELAAVRAEMSHVFELAKMISMLDLRLWEWHSCNILWSEHKLWT